jgi:hypothetical protein
MKWRLILLGLGIGLFFAAYSLGTAVQPSKEQAEIIRKELGQKNQNINQLSIFTNNVVPALEMFVPALGVLVGANAAYSTGQAFAAFALNNPALRNIFPVSLLFSPFALMEIFAYGLAISRSGFLVYYLIRKRSLKYYKLEFFIPIIIEIGIVVLILFIGSIIEWQVLVHRQQMAKMGGHST